MKFKLYFFILLLISVFVAFFITAFSVNEFSFVAFLNIFSWSFLYSMFLGLGNAYLAPFLDRFYNWIDQTVQRVVLGLLATVVYSFFIAVLIPFIMLVVLKGYSLDSLMHKEAFDSYFTITWVSLIVSLFFHARGFIVEYKAKFKEAEELKTQKLKAEINSLQKQMDAHFLFNSLNILKQLIEEDKNLALSYVDDFADVYRYIVENNSKEKVALNKELKFIDSYLELFKIRFETALKTDVTIKDCFQNGNIAPLSIQIAIENAINHNLFNPSKPLNIAIYCKNNYLIIKNNRNENPNTKGTGTALKNLDKRTELVFKKNIIILKDKESFILKIPVEKS